MTDLEKCFTLNGPMLSDPDFEKKLDAILCPDGELITRDEYRRNQAVWRQRLRRLKRRRRTK